jgi:serine protease Do
MAVMRIMRIMRMTRIMVWWRVAALAALALGVSGASARGGPDDEDLRAVRSLSRAFERAADQIEESVVHITTASEIQRVRQDIFGRRFRVGPPEMRQTGLGSGVIISRDGLVLTNHHVIANGDRLVVRVFDGRELDATLVGSDEATDLAVLKIDAPDLIPASFGDSDGLRVGEWVLAIGSPFGFDSTVTAGIVSAKGRRLAGEAGDRYQEFIQTDASINPGNSGGPLINLDGEIVGINTAIISATRQSAGLGFAIPSALARRVVESIVESGRVERGYLGVSMADLNPDQRRTLGLAPDEGVLVERVVEGSPASQAGLRAGDIVLAINGREVTGGMNRLRNLIALSPPGSEISIRVLRDGRTQDLSARVADLASAQARELGGVPVEALGVFVRATSPQISREMGYTRHVPGVQVLGVMPGTPAASAGLERGDILTAVGGRRVESVEALAQALGRVRGAAPVELVRGRMRGTIEVELR